MQWYNKVTNACQSNKPDATYTEEYWQEVHGATWEPKDNTFVPPAPVPTKEQRITALNQESFAKSQELKASYASAYLGVILKNPDGTDKTQEAIDAEVATIRNAIKVEFDALRDYTIEQQGVILNG